MLAVLGLRPKQSLPPTIIKRRISEKYLKEIKRKVILLPFFFYNSGQALGPINRWLTA